MTSTAVSLGKLETVDLRAAWPNEATNFTPWLAEDSNLELLSETLGLQLELEAVEKAVGPFSADILAKDLLSGEWVLIENQVAPTDHKHLGQLLTYAAGLEAKMVIWIAESFHERHRAALDFLNRATGEEYAFFGIRVELFRIGESALAPNFSVVAKPNNWSKSAQAARQAAQDELSPSQLLWKEFWGQLVDKAANRYPPLAGRTPYKGNWQTAERLLSAKSLYVDLNASFTRDRLRVEVYIGGATAKAVYHALEKRRNEIDGIIGVKLDWEELPKGQDSRVSFYMDGKQNQKDSGFWADQQEWILVNGMKLADTFRPHLNSLDLEEIEQLELVGEAE